jgi:MFS family permease
VKKDSGYRWYVLILAALTVAVVIGVPSMSLAVLFEEISGELKLDLVQMGWIWSIGSLPAIVTGSLAGALIDRFGPRPVICAGILLVGLSAAARGLAGGFASMLMIILVVGALVPLVSTAGFKISGIWFPRRQLGLANGILSMGMALGLLLGSLLSATVFSPWLGGWRRVMFFYGALAVLFCIPWLLARAAPEKSPDGGEPVPSVPMRRALACVLTLKNIWLLGLTFLGIGGCQQGISGYLALYLRGIGWADGAADGAAALIFAMSLTFILPIAFLSDRLGSRKSVLLGALGVMAAGSGLLSIAGGWIVWGAVALAGMMRDGSAALVLTMAVETEGVGPAYAGTATGVVMTFFFLGNLISPPIGNKLADIAPGLPFAFWGGMAAMGIISLLMIRNPRILRGSPESSAAR